MSDLELLFLVLAVIYLWECACWLPRGSVAFLTWLGRRWRVRHPGALMGNQRGGFILAPALPPLGTILIGGQLPLSISPDGVLAFVSTAVNPAGRPAQTGKFLRFDEIQSVSASSKRLLINGALFVKAASPLLAAKFASQVQDLTRLSPQKRQSAIEDILTESLDTKLLDRRWKQFSDLAGDIRLVTNFLFAWLFVCAPLVIWQFGFRSSWIGLLAGLLAMTVGSAIVFRRAHKILYPQAEEERFTHFLTVLLSPATTIRTRDILSRPLLQDFHPLAIAKVFCRETEFRAFAQRVLLEIRQPAWPLCPNPEPAAKVAEEFWRGMLLNCVEKFLKRSGVDPAQLAKPPVPADDTCHSYCPRCLAQFTTSTGACGDCGGLPLVTFPSSPDAGSDSPAPFPKGSGPARPPKAGRRSG